MNRSSNNLIYIPERAARTCRSSHKPTKREIQEQEDLELMAFLTALERQVKKDNQDKRNAEADAFLFLYSN